MVKDVYYGKTLRKSFARHEEVLEMPTLLEIQKNSYQWFLDTGLQEVFRDVAALSDYAGNRYDTICRAWAAFTEEACRDLSPERRRKCREIFRSCSEHEYHFWEMSARPRDDI